MIDNRTSILQTISHILVVGAGVVYLIGFFVVSAFDAKYGITDYSLFRTRVIGVGILFFCLVALPVLGTLRGFALFGLDLERPFTQKVEIKKENRIFVIADAYLTSPLIAAGFPYLLVFLFPAFPEWAGIGILILVVQMALAVTLRLACHKWFNDHPLILSGLSFLNAIALFLNLYRYADRTLFWTTAWFTSISIFTLAISLKSRTPTDIRKTEWERMVLAIIPVVLLTYASKVYPKIRREFGGGSPVPIVLHLTKKLSPFGSDAPSVSLIEETEQGYYVLGSSDKAAFISRGLVEEVEFLNSVNQSQSAR